MLSVSSRREFFAAVDRGRTIALSAYALAGSGPDSLLQHLEDAASRGARVSVRLEAAPYDAPALAARNAEAVRLLRERGADAALADGPALLHIKAAVIDGAAYLDDRNWPRSGDTILRSSDPDDAALADAAIKGETGGNGHFATGKRGALALEAALVSEARAGEVDCESESFGFCGVEEALRARAAAGGKVRLLVDRAELGAPGSPQRRALKKLQAAGVEVRAGSAAEKLCAVPGAVWAGSANATSGAADSVDWGMVTPDKAVGADVRARFATHWARARPV